MAFSHTGSRKGSPCWGSFDPGRRKWFPKRGGRGLRDRSAFASAADEFNRVWPIGGYDFAVELEGKAAPTSGQGDNPVPSTAWQRWQTERMPRLAEVDAQC